MPLYEYACVLCDHHFDLRHGAYEKPELSCPQCGGSVKKVFHASGIIFKGSGWYVTDSAPKRAPEKEESTAAAPAPASATTPAAPAPPATPATPPTPTTT